MYLYQVLTILLLFHNESSCSLQLNNSFDEALNQLLNSTHRLLSYFETSNYHHTVDVVGSFRMGQGQLMKLNKSFVLNLCKNVACKGEMLWLKLDNILSRVDRLAYVTSVEVANRESDFGYFSRFVSLMRSPFRYNSSWKTFSSQLRKDGNHSEELDVERMMDYDVKFGDICYEKLFGSDSILNSECYVDNHCIRYMLYRDNMAGYALSHKVLYGILMKFLNCSLIVDRIVRERSLSSADQIMELECLLISRELQQLVRMFQDRNATNMDDSSTNSHLISMQDLFSEHMVLCGIEGYWQTLKWKYVRQTMDWQNKKGCVQFILTSANGRSIERCSSHHNSLTLAAWLTYIRMAIELQILN